MLVKKERKNFFNLFLGTLFAKVAGVLREVVFLFFLGFSNNFSELLSLLAIVSALTILGDTSILNSILFPIWSQNIENKKITINLTYKNLFISVLITSAIFIYNFLFISNGTYSLGLQFIVSILWILILMSSLGFSVLIYTERFKESKYVSLFNGIVFLGSAFLVLIFSVEGYLYSRILALLFNIVCMYYLLRDKLIITFSFNRLISSKINLWTIFSNFFNTNKILWFVVSIRIIFSLFFESNMAALNYSLVLSLSLYTLFSKNIASVLIKSQIEGKELDKNFKNKYFLISGGFIVCILILYFVVKEINIDFISNQILMIYRTLFYAIISLFMASILGYSDICHQGFIKENKNRNKVWFNLMYILISVLFFITGVWFYE